MSVAISNFTLQKISCRMASFNSANEDGTLPKLEILCNTIAKNQHVSSPLNKGSQELTINDKLAVRQMFLSKTALGISYEDMYESYCA